MQDSSTPMPSPAATARPGERKPPKIAAIRPFSPMVRPESQEASVSGAISAPPSVLIAPPAANTNTVIRCGLIPMSRAARPLSEHARMARPTCVKARTTNTSASMTAVPNQIQSACTGKMAPQRKNTSSPLKPGTLSGSLPQIRKAAPRIATATPSVTVICTNCGAARMGRMVSRSCSAPNRAPAAVAAARLAGNGSCMAAIDASSNPPSAPYSPCARFTTPDTLTTSTIAKATSA
jgi:hypothetical protein